MKYFYKITTESALFRFKKACDRADIDCFTISHGGLWYAATKEDLKLLKWDGIEKFKIT